MSSFGEDERLDLVAEADDLGRVDVVADRQLAAGDHALGLVADVEQDLVLVDLDHRALDDLAVLDVDHGAGDGVLEAAFEVVGGDLAGDVLVSVRGARGFGGVTVAVWSDNGDALLGNGWDRWTGTPLDAAGAQGRSRLPGLLQR